MKKYNKFDIDRVKSAADIRDFIPGLSGRGATQYCECPECHKSGRNKGLCVTHKTNMDIAKCFSCGFTINGAIDAVQYYDKVEFIDALQIVASRYNILLETEMEKRQRAIDRSREKVKQSFCLSQLEASGLTVKDVTAKVRLDDKSGEIYLPAFKAAVEEGGAWSIMGAYNKIRGQHACHNDFTLNKILKDDWKFDGCVITDWGGAHDTYEAAVNGLDIEMGSYTNGLTSESVFTYNDYYLANPYLQMLKDGKVPMSTIDDKASRILRLIFRTAMNRQKPYGSVATEEHYAAAREIGNEGIVLLKNAPVIKKGAPLLPIDAAKYQNILVVGDNAVRLLNQGGGSSELKVKDMVSPLDGLRAVYGDKVAYAKGYAAGRPMYGRADEIPQNVVDSLRAEAVEMAKKADLVVLVGGLNKNHFQDCEGGDRLEYGLPFGQDELIEALLGVNKNLVLVLLSGNAVEMPWVSRVPAIVQGWYLGSMGGKSLADILSGAVNPSGKLPFSFPAKLTDCGAHAFDELSYPGDSIKQEYKEDILVGYRWHDTKKVPALFPFGHGLSYTTFTYGKPVASAKAMAADGTLTLTVAVKNTGSVAGKEIVQLYIGDDKCSVLRPVKELKHFAKVALAPGEEKNVTFTLTPDDLKFYDEASAAWKYEPGKFKAYVCASSADVRGVVPFEMQ